MTESEQSAIFGGGCFWCVEAAFKEVKGVKTVTAGYAGGGTENPTYQEVCTGDTGHAEVVRIEYDANRITYDELLEVFFSIHDPTQLNRQGPDVGSQYRSIILYQNERQRKQATTFKEAVDETYEDDVVTEIEPLETFYQAEEKHQNYFEKNPNDAYCQMHAQPKIEKVREKFETKSTKV
ncbi:MAG: peptide-methionine (S)-S-oxide reductase MsrA [Halobacteriaceae archaeon]